MSETYHQQNTYKNGYLKVGDGYELYYECYGNPNGKPLLFVHGGPGIGFSDEAKRFFDPKIWNVILFDQRGSGRSRPHASLKNNTTKDLVDDMNKLLDSLKIDKAVLFGGSWGSTLALVYAIQNRERVSGIIVRGIFLCNKDDDYHFDNTIQNFFPESWERFMHLVPSEKRNNAIAYYYEKMTTGDQKNRDKYAFEWDLYEGFITKMNNTSITAFEEELKNDFDFAMSLIEIHYIVNKCFLEDNYILKNAHVLSDVPVSIVHGRYDFVCPPINAYNLHKQIKNSKLSFVISGHSSSDEALEDKLIEEVQRFESLV